MAEIVPAILTTDQTQYQTLLNSFSGFAKRVQIDICDGQFTPNTTIPETVATWQVGPTSPTVDFHMMVVKPSEHLANIIKLKPALCIFHAETGEDLLPIFAELKKVGIKAGVALAKPTYPGKVKPFIEAADHVLIFGGDLGKQGGSADLLQIEKVKIIKTINPEAELGWDGGANMTNVRAIAHAGFDVINVGSAISTAPNPAEVYEALVAEADKRGVAL